MAKAYGLSFDYVLYDISFANLQLYGAVLPSYSSKKDKDQDISFDDNMSQADKLLGIKR